MKNKKTKKRKNIIVMSILIISAILLAIGLVVTINSNIKTKTLNIKDRVNKVNNMILNGASIDELNEVIKSEKLDSNSLLTGEDSYMRLKPSEELIKNNQLAKYSEKQEQLSTKLEKLIVEELDIQMNSESNKRKEGTATVYSGVVKSFYLTQYIGDLKKLEDILCDKYISEENNNNIEKYKIKVIAMEILDKYIDNYKNEDEYSGFNIYVYDDDSKTADSIVSYLNMLQGVNFNNEQVTNLEKTREERLKSYLENNTYEKIKSEFDN